MHYTLQAFVVHRGSATSGHYVTYARFVRYSLFLYILSAIFLFILSFHIKLMFTNCVLGAALQVVANVKEKIGSYAMTIRWSTLLLSHLFAKETQ